MDALTVNEVSQRQAIMGKKHMVSAGHYHAAHAGFDILQAGGNAVDAGVAAGLAIGVTLVDFVNIAGVAPIMIYLAETDEVVTLAGVGTWPRAASCDYFNREHGGKIPPGPSRVVVPAAPHSFLTALEKYGTMSFGEVAAAAIRLAGEGFPAHAQLCHSFEKNEAAHRTWPQNAEVFLPGGRPPKPGDLFVQADLAKSLQYMADQEAAAGGDRAAGVRAARDAFYKGDIADAIADFHAANGGLMTREDLAGYEVEIAPPVGGRFGDLDVYACGPWCQGPVIPMALNLLKTFDLKGMGHNSPEYVHTLTEAFKLVFADRERYIGDPAFVDVPIDGMLSDAYADARRTLIRPDVAWPEMPPAGDPRNLKATLDERPADLVGASGEPDLRDTSYCCAMDSFGNVFSCTPSDGPHAVPMVPGTGFVPSGRGSQSWTDPAHASSVAPGKRPRLTPNPAIAFKDGKPVMPFGTPGGDVQIQAMIQVFLNVFVFGMEPQRAVEAPRFATQSFPNSFSPHHYFPGLLNLEARIPKAVGDRLAELGNEVKWWDEHSYSAGAVLGIVRNPDTGVMAGAADPRRPTYALGW